MSKRDFLTVTDLSADELALVLSLAVRPVSLLSRPLEGLGVALIFEKPSNRTRQSMEMAVVQLGGHPVYTRGEEIQFDVRESVEDVARSMSGYHALVGARVFKHEVVERLADAATVSIINMLSDRAHPMQALADVVTMTEVLGPLAGRTVAWVGDYNNVARSLGEACVMLGALIRYGTPAGYGPSVAEVARLAALGSGAVETFEDPCEAVKGADAVHTDTWTSMGQESEREARVRTFGPYTVTMNLMRAAAPGAGFYHCAPVYRELEVSAEVMDSDLSHVVRQGHNRLHASRGLLAFLSGVR